MASALATHNDEELEQLFDPEYLYLEAFRTIGWRGTLKGQGILDPAQLELCLERNVKDKSFLILLFLQRIHIKSHVCLTHYRLLMY